MILAVPKEILNNEKRVAVTPDIISKFIKLGYDVHIETNAGLNAGLSDDQYSNAGAKIVNSLPDLYSNADLILKVQRPFIHPDFNKYEIELMRKDSILVSFLYYLNNPDVVQKCAQHGINAIAMEAIPRITKAQRMDALSSQANLAGYKSVIMTANHLGKIFPLMMTAAGTISPAKVVIMGAGVAGLQAVATARRLGAIVEVSDIRPQVKEEVLSLGGRFIEIETDKTLQDEKGYAREVSKEFLQKQQDLIFKHVSAADIVITTALVPGKKAPVLVTADMVKNMRPCSVILDMAVEFGGNCELSESGKTVVKHGVTIIGEPNIPSLVPVHASEMYAKNLLGLVEYITKDGKINFDLDDEIIKSTLITYNGEILKS